MSSIKKRPIGYTHKTNNTSIVAMLFSVMAITICMVTFLVLYPKPKLAYVDVNKLLQHYDRTEVDREAFEKKAAILKANVDSLINDWQNELKVYEKERASMTKKELTLKQELLQHKQQQINNYQHAVQEQIEEEDQKMTQTVVNDINDFVKAYGKKEGHLIIFGAQGNGNIMYAHKGVDLTDEILERLNQQYHGK